MEKIFKKSTIGLLEKIVFVWPKLEYFLCKNKHNTISLMSSERGDIYDSVRGTFFEGEELYHNSGFKSKNHIQIAIRNHNCIKGYFIPRELDDNFKKI